MKGYISFITPSQIKLPLQEIACGSTVFDKLGCNIMSKMPQIDDCTELSDRKHHTIEVAILINEETRQIILKLC